MDDREIFERYAERVLQFFANKVSSPSDPADLAQETFTRYFERARRGDVASPRAFLFGVARFVLLEYWKGKQRQPDAFDPGACSIIEMGAAKTTLSSLLARQEGRGLVLDAMRHLRLDYQNALELRYWHDLKYDEIAEVLGQNAQTVGVWLRRAKAELKRVIESLPEGEGKAGSGFSPTALEQWLHDSGDLAQEVVRQSDDAENGDGDDGDDH